MFDNIGVLKNFIKFTKKYKWWSPFLIWFIYKINFVQKIHSKAPVPEALFNKVAVLRPASFLKEGFGTSVFL